MRISDTFNKIFTVQLFNLILKKNYANLNYLDVFLGYKSYLKVPQEITQAVAQYTKLLQKIVLLFFFIQYKMGGKELDFKDKKINKKDFCRNKKQFKIKT